MIDKIYTNGKYRFKESHQSRLIFTPRSRTIELMKHNLLCIDDEIHNLEALERLLRKTYNVVLAESGAEALEKMKDTTFSLIISDQKMPSMTGVEFFKEAIKLQPKAIRILLTGYTDLESVISAINQGQIYRYITKPWDPEELLGIVQQAIDVFEMRQTIELQNIELQKANDELKSLDTLKTDFMLLVNHELKTPLTAIFSFSQLLSEESLNSEQKLYVDKIAKNTNRLQNLINDTLLITRLKASGNNEEKTVLDISSLLKSTWEQKDKEFKDKTLKLKLVSSETFSQSVNEKFIKIILEKLIHNSFSHAKLNTEVFFELKETTDAWTLHTSNQLVKKIEKDPRGLMQSFSRDEKILNHSGGAGLGLAVIQSILQLFSAEIEIDYDDQMFDLKIKFPK